MTPAEHYAEAETLIDLINKVLLDHHDGVTPEIAFNLSWMTALLDGHSRLATVHPALLPRSVPEGCTCPRVASQPLARTGTDPGCPIHGGTP